MTSRVPYRWAKCEESRLRAWDPTRRPPGGTNTPFGRLSMGSTVNTERLWGEVPSATSPTEVKTLQRGPDLVGAGLVRRSG